MELVLAGEALADEIDDYIDQWHDSADTNETTLAQWLGMTEREYGLWVERPHALRAILHARHFNVPLDDALKRLDDDRVRRPDGSIDHELTAWIKERRERA